MKKFVKVIVSALAALCIFSFAGTSVITAQAAGEYQNAVYEGGVYATNGDKELVILYYKDGKNDMVYLNDGKNYMYSDYTLTESAVPGHGNGYKLTAGALVVYSFTTSGNEYMMTDDGVTYCTRDLSAYEAQQIRDAF